MGIREYFTKEMVVNNVSEYTPQIVKNVLDVAKSIAPNFKGEVKNDKITFPEELGEEHPFDFSITEGLYKKFGLTSPVVFIPF